MIQDEDTVEYLAEVLIDAGQFVFKIAIGLAQWLTDAVGIAASPEAIVGVVLLLVIVRTILF